MLPLSQVRHRPHVKTYGRDDWPALMASAAGSHQQLLAAVQALPAEELDRDRGIRFRGWKVTIARLLQAEAEDEATHATQVAAFGRAMEEPRHGQ